MSRQSPKRPLTDTEAGAKLDQEVRRVTRVLMDTRQIPGLYEQLRAGNYKMTHGAMEMLLAELAEFWTDQTTLDYIRETRRESGIAEPPHGGPCATPAWDNGYACGHPQESHDEYTGRCLARDICPCEQYTAARASDATAFFTSGDSEQIEH